MKIESSYKIRNITDNFELIGAKFAKIINKNYFTDYYDWLQKR